jgi:hypothetical protein
MEPPVGASWETPRHGRRLLERCGFERSGTVRYGQAEHIMLVLGAP